jgi:CubicO group peptidase (beta-lactamase class C family)
MMTQKLIPANQISELTEAASQDSDSFNFASITKAYTVKLILKLHKQDKLSLDDTLDQWLPKIAVQIPDSEKITIGELLNAQGKIWDHLSNNDDFIAQIIMTTLSLT